MMYAKNLLIHLAGKRKFLPCNTCPQKFINVGVDLVSPVYFSYNDESFAEYIEILAGSLKQIYKMYKKDYRFTEPMLIYKSEKPRLYFEIGLVEKKK